MHNHNQPQGAQMRHLKVLGVALAAMFALGMSATSAFAIELPDVHVLPGETYPVHAEFPDNGATVSKLLDVSGNELSGKGLKVLFILKELSALGEFEALFLKVLRLPAKVACNTEGDKTETAGGEVLIKGTYHIVLAVEGTARPPAVLYLFNELKIKCGSATIKVKGAAISTFNTENKKETEDFTQLCGELKGNTKGVNKLTKYLNDEGKEVEGKLEDNFGNGFVQSAEEVEEEVCAKILPTSLGLMVSVLNR
jgi:hypothetical protein